MTPTDPAQESNAALECGGARLGVLPRSRLLAPTPDRNRELASAGGFGEVAVEELTGVMRFDSRDDYWTFTTSGAGPVAQLVASLDDQVGAIRATPDPSLAAFEHDDKLELPWLSVVTSAV